MNSSSCAVFCFVVVIISVNGQRDEPKLNYANPPPRTSQKQPPRPPGSVGQQNRPPPPSYYTDPRNNHNMGVNVIPSYAGNFGTFHTSNDEPKLYYANPPPRTSQKQPPRPPGSVGQQNRPPPPSYYTDPRNNHNMGVNVIPSYAGNFGTFHTSNDEPRLQYENKPPQNWPTGRSLQYNPRGSFGQQPLPSYDYHNLRPNANSDLGPMYNSRDEPKFYYANPPPRTSQKQPPRPPGSVGQQNRPPPPSYYTDPRNNHNMGVNAFPSYASNFGTFHTSNDDPNIGYENMPPQSSQNHWPPLNNYDPRDFNEMEVINYKYRPNGNSDMGPIYNIVVSKHQNTRPIRPPFIYHYQQHDHKMDVNYKLRPNVNNDLGSKHNSRGEPVKLQIKNKPFEFEYKEQHIGSLLQMNMSFKLASNVHSGFVFIRSSLRDNTQGKTFEIRRPNLSDETDKVANIQWYVTKENVYIDVELRNKTGVCLYKRISHGKMLDQKLRKNDLKHPITDSPNCLYGNICQIEVDLMEECGGVEIIETTNDNTILIVSLSIFATALVVFAIVAFFNRCWFKRDAQDRLQVPQPSCSLPFYVNLLYRKECEEIIDDLEQNQYELID